MIDIGLLKSGAKRALPEALGKALLRFMRDNELSTRDAGERLGIVHTNLVKSRIFTRRNIDHVGLICESALAVLPAEREVARKELLSHLRARLGSIKAQRTVITY
jgi:hypothetical protein